MNKNIPFSPPDITDLEIENVIEVLKSGWITTGPKTKEFERKIADYCNTNRAICFNSATAGMEMTLRLLGIGEGDEVITTPYTFFATAESISFVGATPVFVDVELDTFNIDPTKIEEKITSKTKAIMPVHIFGQPCDMDAINSIAKKHNLYVIEDAAQAIGSEYKGQKIGTLSDIATFSFFPTKNLGCAGDGGMIVTNDDNLAMICKALRAHGSGENGQKAYNILNDIDEDIQEDESADNTVYNPLKYYNYLIGHNSRLDELQAAILRIKLRKLDQWNTLRRENAQFYNNQLSDSNLVTPFEDKNVKHVYHLYILQSDKRADIVAFLAEKGMATGVYYPVPLHLQKAYTSLGYKEGDMPNAEYLSHRTFAIPMFAELIDEEKQYIADNLKKFGE